MAPKCVSEIFRIESIHQRLRNCDFELPRFDTVAYGRRSLRYQGPFIWSKVSGELINLTILKAFKNHIRVGDLSSHIDNNSNCCVILSRGHLHIVLGLRTEIINLKNHVID